MLKVFTPHQTGSPTSYFLSTLGRKTSGFLKKSRVFFNVSGFLKITGFLNVSGLFFEGFYTKNTGFLVIHVVILKGEGCQRSYVE